MSPSFMEPVDFRPEEQKADTAVQPQHEQHDGRQAPVHIGEVAAAEQPEIQGEGHGEQDPARGGEHGAGELGF